MVRNSEINTWSGAQERAPRHAPSARYVRAVSKQECGLVAVLIGLVTLGDEEPGMWTIHCTVLTSAVQEAPSRAISHT